MFYTAALSPAERRVRQEQIDAVFRVLEGWFQAIENGTAHHRLPDPHFQPLPGRPAITEELVEHFIGELDREMDTDAFGAQGRKFAADASCEFHRLAYPQKVALVQQIMGVVLSDAEITQKAQALTEAEGSQEPQGRPGYG